MPRKHLFESTSPWTCTSPSLGLPFFLREDQTENPIYCRWILGSCCTYILEIRKNMGKVSRFDQSSLLFECDLWLSCELAFIACCIISTFRSLGISATQTDRICLTSLILQMSKQEWRICPMTVDDMFTTISKMCIQPARMPHNPLVHGCLCLLFWFPR